jgi:hypothetical protein
MQHDGCRSCTTRRASAGRCPPCWDSVGDRVRPARSFAPPRRSEPHPEAAEPLGRLPPPCATTNGPSEIVGGRRWLMRATCHARPFAACRAIGWFGARARPSTSRVLRSRRAEWPPPATQCRSFPRPALSPRTSPLGARMARTHRQTNRSRWVRFRPAGVSPRLQQLSLITQTRAVRPVLRPRRYASDRTRHPDARVRRAAVSHCCGCWQGTCKAGDLPHRRRSKHSQKRCRGLRRQETGSAYTSAWLVALTLPPPLSAAAPWAARRSPPR